MDQQLELRNHASIIGPVTDFAYRWGLNVGLSDEKARRLALVGPWADLVVVAYAAALGTLILFSSD